MTSITAFRIHDLPVEVLSLILGSFPGEESRHEFPFFELRLVCRLWNKIASPHLFRAVQLGRGRRTFQRWRRLLSRKRIRKHIQHVRIDCQNEYPPYHEIIKWKWHFARAIGCLKDLEQLNELSIHFEKSCDLEGWREGVTSKFRSFFATGARMWILSKLAAALKERAVTVPNCRPVRSLTIYNLQNFPAWNVGSFDEPTDITFLAQSLRELDLTFVSENYTEIDFYDHGDWDPGKVKRCNFTPYLRHNWLVPTMEYLTSLSISSVERWGTIPSYFDGKGLEFPHLRSLALSNFVVGHHNQFNWVLRQKALQSLYLLDNAILSYIFHDGIIKEQANVLIHDWIMLGDSQYYFPGTWEAVFDRINEELPRLKDFWFCSDAGVYPPQPGKLCHVRYISFHSCERPVWNTCARTDGDLEWDWTTNRAKETFRGDSRAYESLLQKVLKRPMKA
ncbi:unnamed protein product [Clonostachys chloroleuca]|uniref:F-box domain-containing protein n=1 Tax=Clonostachys chloroleuca TaxID=1926264 RepID=A0AA35Q2C1_9HYPO|nr:unnamed protein product [Clonostachys chloroleuca]